MAGVVDRLAAAQQCVHLTGRILGDLQAFSWHRFDSEAALPPTMATHSLCGCAAFGSQNPPMQLKQVVTWLNGLQHPDWEKTYTIPYSIISAGEMFVCWVAHDNLHIRQLVGLRRPRLETITKPYNLEYAGDW